MCEHVDVLDSEERKREQAKERETKSKNSARKQIGHTFLQSDCKKSDVNGCSKHRAVLADSHMQICTGIAEEKHVSTHSFVSKQSVHQFP